MTAAVLLLGYAVAVAAFATVLLPRAGWVTRAPRLGIWLWQMASASVLLSAVLAGLVLAVPMVPVGGGLAEVLHACAEALCRQYATPGGAVAAAGGTLLAGTLLVRVGWCLGSTVVRARRERGRHLRVLAMVGRDRADLGVTVLQDDRPAAYCLPGLRHRIVLTSAALAVLEPDALNSVIAHERAHIRQRHHLVIAWADALRRAVPGVRFFAAAAAETGRLVELAADDEATGRTSAVMLAGALVDLAGAGAPAASLAASGGQVADRVRRLLGPRRPLHRAVATAGAVAATAVLVLPVLLVARPATKHAGGMDDCPLPNAPVAAPRSAA